MECVLRILADKEFNRNGLQQMVNFGIVNNGFFETIYNVDDGHIVRMLLLFDESEDAMSYLQKNFESYKVVSYGCYW